MGGAGGYAGGGGFGGGFHGGLHGGGGALHAGGGGGGGGGACGCDDSCGTGPGGGAGCGTGYDTTGVLSYVGAGGDYRQETTYKYVGHGAGDFEAVPVVTNVSRNMCWCIIPLLLSLLLLPLLLFLLPQLSAADTTTTPVPVVMTAPAPITTSEPYDCKTQGLWSFDKKGWCCKNYGVGCPTTPPPAPPPPPPPPAPSAPAPPRPVPAAPRPVAPMVISTTSACPYDCNAGYNEWPMQWVKGWTGGKK